MFGGIFSAYVVSLVHILTISRLSCAMALVGMKPPVPLPQ